MFSQNRVVGPRKLHSAIGIIIYSTYDRGGTCKPKSRLCTACESCFVAVLSLCFVCLVLILWLSFVCLVGFLILSKLLPLESILLRRRAQMLILNCFSQCV